MGLYPTFDLPKMTAPKGSKVTEYKGAPYFDFDVGDFVLDGAHRPTMANGKEAFCQWCLKVCATERRTRLAYSDSIGVEIQKAAKDCKDIAALQSAIERTITEAILVNPAAELVKNFSFQYDGDHLWVTFTVVSTPYGEETLRVVY